MNVYELIASGKKIIVFDGECNLCNRWVQFLLKHDPQDIFYFCSLTSPLGIELQRNYGIKPGDIDSIIVLDNSCKEGYIIKSSAVLTILKYLGFPWSVSRVFLIIPRSLRDVFYDCVSRKRYAWFGKKNICMIIGDNMKYKFLDL